MEGGYVHVIRAAIKKSKKSEFISPTKMKASQKALDRERAGRPNHAANGSLF